MIHGLRKPISGMVAAKTGEKTKIDTSKTQLLIVLVLQYEPLDVCF